MTVGRAEGAGGDTEVPEEEEQMEGNIKAIIPSFQIGAAISRFNYFFFSHPTFPLLSPPSWLPLTTGKIKAVWGICLLIPSPILDDGASRSGRRRR